MEIDVGGGGVNKHIEEAKQKCIKELIILQHHDDPVIAHINADITLCNLLTALDMEDVVLEYTKVQKYFG